MLPLVVTDFDCSRWADEHGDIARRLQDIADSKQQVQQQMDELGQQMQQKQQQLEQSRIRWVLLLILLP